MSADNGYILRKNKDQKFVLQMYFASSGDYPPITPVNERQVFDTLEEAIVAYEEIVSNSEFPIEYGLTVKIKQVSE